MPRHTGTMHMLQVLQHLNMISFSRDPQEGDAWYEKMCKFTLAADGWGTYAAGAVSSSGYGDGMYPVYGAEVDGKIVALQLVFISQEEDEDDWEGEFLDDEDEE